MVFRSRSLDRFGHADFTADFLAEPLDQLLAGHQFPFPDRRDFRPSGRRGVTEILPVNEFALDRLAFNRLVRLARREGAVLVFVGLVVNAALLVPVDALIVSGQRDMVGDFLGCVRDISRPCLSPGA